MKTIVLNSQKGGSGKTTLCRILSVEAAHPEKNEGIAPVYLIDTDPQGTLNNQKAAIEQLVAELGVYDIARRSLLAA